MVNELTKSKRYCLYFANAIPQATTKQTILDCITALVPDFTFYEGLGCYHGVAEKCYILDVLVPAEFNVLARLRALANDLLVLCNQKAVLLTVTDCDATLIQASK